MSGVNIKACDCELSLESKVSRELNVTIYLLKQFTKKYRFTYQRKVG